MTIPNWQEYNPRRDVKRPSWFRLDHGLFDDPDFYDFTHAEICVWIYLLCQASRKNSDIIQVNESHAERIGRLPSAVIQSALKKLERIGAVTVSDTGTSRERDADVTDTNATYVRTYERTDAKISLLREESKKCQATWLETLKVLGHERGIDLTEETRITQAIQKHGAENVDLALFGARFEPKSKDFDPAKYVSVDRIFLPDRQGKNRFPQYLNWGASGRKQARREIFNPEEKPAC